MAGSLRRDGVPHSPDDVSCGILWTPDRTRCDRSAETRPQAALPPPEIFENALRMLRLSFTSECQYLRVSRSGEPILGLYCPIEGADYVIDETVKELASQIGAEVLVVDSVHLLAGKCGRFAGFEGCVAFNGEANPLRAETRSGDDPPAEETDNYDPFKPLPRRARPRRDPYYQHMPDYFRNIINIKSSSPSSSNACRPRIVYVRDVSSIASMFSAWYAPLLSAVIEYRGLNTSSAYRRRDNVISNVASYRSEHSDRHRQQQYNNSQSDVAPYHKSDERSYRRPTEDAIPDRHPSHARYRRNLDEDNERQDEEYVASYQPLDTKFKQDSGYGVEDRRGESSRRSAGDPRRHLSPQRRRTNEEAIRTPDPFTLRVAGNSEIDRFTATAKARSPSVTDIESPFAVGSSSGALADGYNRQRSEGGDFDADDTTSESSSADTDAYQVTSGHLPTGHSPFSPILAQPYTEGIIKPVTLVFGMSHPAPETLYVDDDDQVQEKRLQARLCKWAKGDSFLYPDIPKLFRDTLDQTSDFRMATLVPRMREMEREKRQRASRNLEINELMIRMGIADAQGVLEKASVDYRPFQLEDDNSRIPDLSACSGAKEMIQQWEAKRQPWSTIFRVAKAAVEHTLSLISSSSWSEQKSDLELVQVSWYAVVEGWLTLKENQGLVNFRASWVREFAGTEIDGPQVEDHDELLETLKQNGMLNAHERRILDCVVDRASIITTFRDVSLPTATIDAVRTMVSLPLLYPEEFSCGIFKKHNMTGCLLFGPPGTGKTMIAKAVAAETQCRMIAIKPADVLSKWFGESENIVKAVFSVARHLSPCIIFLDEIDALLRARGGRDNGNYDSTTSRRMINQFMQEMDGIVTLSKHNVIVIGATNRPFDLDDAILRRLPRRLLIDLPDEGERRSILTILLQAEALHATVDLGFLAARTDKFSGSDLKHLCVSAAIIAIKETVDVPWRDATSSSPRQDNLKRSSTRILYPKHFSEALRAVKPSTSESFDSVIALRKWDQKFGEGQRETKARVGSSTSMSPLISSALNGALPHTREPLYSTRSPHNLDLYEEYVAEQYNSAAVKKR